MNSVDVIKASFDGEASCFSTILWFISEVHDLHSRQKRQIDPGGEHSSVCDICILGCIIIKYDELFMDHVSSQQPGSIFLFFIFFSFISLMHSCTISVLMALCYVLTCRMLYCCLLCEIEIGLIVNNHKKYCIPLTTLFIDLHLGTLNSDWLRFCQWNIKECCCK